MFFLLKRTSSHPECFACVLPTRSMFREKWYKAHTTHILCFFFSVRSFFCSKETLNRQNTFGFEECVCVCCVYVIEKRRKKKGREHKNYTSSWSSRAEREQREQKKEEVERKKMNRKPKWREKSRARFRKLRLFYVLKVFGGECAAHEEWAKTTTTRQCDEIIAKREELEKEETREKSAPSMTKQYAYKNHAKRLAPIQAPHNRDFTLCSLSPLPRRFHLSSDFYIHFSDDEQTAHTQMGNKRQQHREPAIKLNSSSNGDNTMIIANNTFRVFAHTRLLCVHNHTQQQRHDKQYSIRACVWVFDRQRPSNRKPH